MRLQELHLPISPRRQECTFVWQGNQSVKQSDNRSIRKSINQSDNQSINQSISQSINQSINQSIERTYFQCVHGNFQDDRRKKIAKCGFRAEKRGDDGIIQEFHRENVHKLHGNPPNGQHATRVKEWFDRESFRPENWRARPTTKKTP